MTFGHKSSWQPVIEWASRNGVLRGLYEVVDVLQSHQTPTRLAAVFDGITKPSNHERLSKWSEASDEASLLFGIANAICRDRTIRNFVPSLSQGSSARTQLLGELSESYLLAVFVEQMFPCDSQHVDWLATLRTWLLVTGLRLARHGNVQDRLLRSVSRAVRLACNHDEPWGRLLFALATDCDEVAELNGHLAYRGAQVLEYSKDAYTNSQRPVLNAIVRLARGMEDPDRKLASQISLLSNFPELPPPTAVSDYFLESEAYNSDDAAADIPQFPSMGTTTGRIVSAQVAQTNSYQRQRLTSKSIYLLGAEELHYLPWSWNTITPFEKSVFEDWVDQLIASREHKRQLLGAYLWVSTQSGRSLDRVANYEISDEVSDDWRVASSFDVLHRRPPSRKGDWRPVTDSELAWVTPASDIIRLQLPPNVAKILARSSTRVNHRRAGSFQRERLLCRVAASTRLNQVRLTTHRRVRELHMLGKARACPEAGGGEQPVRYLY